MSGIYGYWDTEKNCVVYIGRDYNIDKKIRHNSHISPRCYDEQPINRVIQNNPGRYLYFVLAEGDFTSEELNNMESHAIELFKTFKYDYPEREVFNFTKGGDGAIGRIPSDETRKKQSKTMKGRYCNTNNPFYGKKHTEETKKRNAEAHTGKNNTFYKNYARIIKKGFNNGKQVYAIIVDTKCIKYSIYPNKLISWFNSNYPNEELVIQ